MTALRKPVQREVSGLLREDLIVSLYPGGVIGIRAKRTRREYQLRLVTVYRQAIEAAHAQARLEKHEARRAGRPHQVARDLLSRG